MRRIAALLLLVASSSAFAQEAPAAAAGADACAVWAREAGFAQSVADHDAAAFASYLHPDAVFIGGDGSGTRGAADYQRAATMTLTNSTESSNR
jgi:ketosteroid isomerase-like protein